MYKEITSNFPLQCPDITVDSKKLFGFKARDKIYGFSKKSDYVPLIDKDYVFDESTTKSILAGFMNNRRVILQGFHGTGKSTHIEQVAARLNWSFVRINLDSHINRLDLIGKDAIVIQEGQQVTTFKKGILPWALENPVALCLDEYDAGRPDIMFVIQRILEADGKLTLLDQNQILTPHKYFRIFATTNTIGLGDTTGLYHGTQPINQGQMDRWDIVCCLNYLPLEKEVEIIASKVQSLNRDTIKQMVRLAQLTRANFKNGDVSTLMSPRTVLTWAQNFLIFDDIAYSFELSFLNKCDDSERVYFLEDFQKCFNIEIVKSK